MKLDGIRKREQAATKGEWYHDNNEGYGRDNIYCQSTVARGNRCERAKHHER
jgi:hypothetical protein